MRSARAEAADRLGGRYDVRVLEPSPPAVVEPPFFADDPVTGGEVLPVQREGARTWAQVCSEESEGDAALRNWCQDRWLVDAPLGQLPQTFVDTRNSLHAIAEHVVAPRRHAANGKIGLRFTYRGFGTPFFAPGDTQVRVEDGAIVVQDNDDERRTAVTTLRAAAEFVGVEPGAQTGVYTPTTDGDPDLDREVDPAAARALGSWFGFCARLLEQLRAEATEDDAAARVQLWPEHFDLAVDLGAGDSRANFGGSPGDADHPKPYLYVGPWKPRDGDFWNEGFGASLSYKRILEGADPLQFLRRGKQLLQGHQ